jgi:hypothetical protein
VRPNADYRLSGAAADAKNYLHPHRRVIDTAFFAYGVN